MRAMDDRFASFRRATAAALLDGSGATPADLRQAIARGTPPPELAALVEKVRSRAYTVTDPDVDALRARYTEDQLFEIVVSAAFGAASDRLAAAHKALEDA
jgi:alkylhydroperoxidase family enzyme